MKTWLFAFALVAASTHAMDKLPFTEADAFREVASGHCGAPSLPCLPGQCNGPRWIVQPIPGTVEVCAAGSGAIQTVAMKTQGKIAQHCVQIEMDAGRPYFINVFSTEPFEPLEWKVPGYMRGKVPLGFQFPPGPTAK